MFGEGLGVQPSGPRKCLPPASRWIFLLEPGWRGLPGPRGGAAPLALLQGGHLSPYLTVQRQKSRKNSCSRAPGRCQDQGQVPRTSDWQLIWKAIVPSAYSRVPHRGGGQGGKIGESVTLGSPVQRENITLMITVMMTVTMSVMGLGNDTAAMTYVY